MIILGISAYYHDSAAALIKDGKVIAAAQEERFTRIKHDASFPENAIRFCLKSAGIGLNQLDSVVFYDKPFLKFERILQTVLDTAPKGLPLFLKSMPVWLKEKLFLKSQIKDELKEIAGEKITVPLMFSTHHLSHAASAFYASPYEESTILTIDGVGEWATASIGLGKGKDITMLQEMHFPHSLGLLYAAFTRFLGFKVNEGEYKVMGLAPYNDPQDGLWKKYLEIVKSEIATLHDDGSLQLNLNYFSFQETEDMIPAKKWEALFGIKLRQADEPLTKEHAALAYALQNYTEDVVLAMASTAQKITGKRNLCLAGGVALNCVANGKLLKTGLFDSIYIQPAAGDAGGALGAALAVYHQHFKKERIVEVDYMQGGALGCEFSDVEIDATIHELGLKAERLEGNQLLEQTAKLLADGKVIGWFQGKMEFGPRALGYRSILADAANPEMQKILNLKIKKRESFRPFAPILLEEELPRYFDDAQPNPYMLFVYPIKDELQICRPAGFFDLSFSEMLKVPGSELPAVTHIDYTARIQTVPPNSTSAIRLLLEEFKRQTGRGVLINTSFNIKDEPIVNSPQDAVQCFLITEMDVLVMGNWVVRK